jgi:hypothetical protein
MNNAKGTGARCLVRLLQVSALLIGSFLILRIDSATQDNCRHIAIHTQQIDVLSRLISVELRPENATEINAMLKRKFEGDYVAIR